MITIDNKEYDETKLSDKGKVAFSQLQNSVAFVPVSADAQLDALSSQATTLENNAIAVANRQKEYGSIASQIEFITEKGLEAWKTITEVVA